MCQETFSEIKTCGKNPKPHTLLVGAQHFQQDPDLSKFERDLGIWCIGFVQVWWQQGAKGVASVTSCQKKLPESSPTCDRANARGSRVALLAKVRPSEKEASTIKWWFEKEGGNLGLKLSLERGKVFLRLVFYFSSFCSGLIDEVISPSEVSLASDSGLSLPCLSFSAHFLQGMAELWWAPGIQPHHTKGLLFFLKIFLAAQSTSLFPKPCDAC